MWGVFRNAARQSMLFKGPDHWEVLQFVYILIVLSLLKCKCLQLDLSMYIFILLAMKSLQESWCLCSTDQLLPILRVSSGLLAIRKSRLRALAGYHIPVCISNKLWGLSIVSWVPQEAAKQQ